jgi:hypothetical protein
VQRQWTGVTVLFIALVGGAYAAGLIGPDDIAKSAVHSEHVRSGEVTKSYLSGV